MKTVTIQIPDDCEVCPNCQGVYNPTRSEGHARLSPGICELIHSGRASGIYDNDHAWWWDALS